MAVLDDGCRQQAAVDRSGLAVDRQVELVAHRLEGGSRLAHPLGDVAPLLVWRLRGLADEVGLLVANQETAALLAALDVEELHGDGNVLALLALSAPLALHAAVTS